MEAALPNLLIRTLSDPVDSHFSPVSASRGGEPSTDHDHFGVSFRSKPLAAGAGGGGSPLSVSPPALHLGVRERKNISPRSAVTAWKVRGGSNEGLEKDGGGGSRGEDIPERTRLLSLGIWDDGIKVDDLAAAAWTDAVEGNQGFPEKEESGVVAAPGVAKEGSSQLQL